MPGRAFQDLEVVKDQLEEPHRERYRGAIVRARSEKYLMGEQSNKQPLAEEKRYALCNELEEIYYNGVTSTGPSAIEKVFVCNFLMARFEVERTPFLLSF